MGKGNAAIGRKASKNSWEAADFVREARGRCSSPPRGGGMALWAEVREALRLLIYRANGELRIGEGVAGGKGKVGGEAAF